MPPEPSAPQPAGVGGIAVKCQELQVLRKLPRPSDSAPGLRLALAAKRARRGVS